MSMKDPLTPAGIKPATFRIVARHLNHCATAPPPPVMKKNTKLLVLKRLWVIYNPFIPNSRVPDYGDNDKDKHDK